MRWVRFGSFLAMGLLGLVGFTQVGVIAASVQTSRVGFKFGVTTTQTYQALFSKLVDENSAKIQELIRVSKDAIKEEGELSKGWFIHAGESDYLAAEQSQYKNCFVAGCHVKYAKDLNAQMLITVQIYMKAYDSVTKKGNFDVSIGIFNADMGLPGYQIPISYEQKTFLDVLSDLLRKDTYEIGSSKLSTLHIAARVRFAILAEKTVLEKTANLTVEGNPAGARVYVDGEELGTLPLRRKVYAANHSKAADGTVFLQLQRTYTVKVETEGFITEEKKVDVTPGATVSLSIALLRDSAVSDAAITGRPGGPPIPLPKKPSIPPWRVVMGIGGIVVAGGLGGLGVSALMLDGRCKNLAAAPSLACPTVFDTKAPGVVLTTVGGLLFVAAVTLLAVPSKKETPKVTVIPQIGPDSVGVGLATKLD